MKQKSVIMSLSGHPDYQTNFSMSAGFLVSPLCRSSIVKKTLQVKLIPQCDDLELLVLRKSNIQLFVNNALIADSCLFDFCIDAVRLPLIPCDRIIVLSHRCLFVIDYQFVFRKSHVSLFPSNLDFNISFTPCNLFLVQDIPFSDKPDSFFTAIVVSSNDNKICILSFSKESLDASFDSQIQPFDRAFIELDGDICSIDCCKFDSKLSIVVHHTSEILLLSYYWLSHENRHEILRFVHPHKIQKYDLCISNAIVYLPSALLLVVEHSKLTLLSTVRNAHGQLFESSVRGHIQYPSIDSIPVAIAQIDEKGFEFVILFHSGQLFHVLLDFSDPSISGTIENLCSLKEKFESISVIKHNHFLGLSCSGKYSDPHILSLDNCHSLTRVSHIPLINGINDIVHVSGKDIALCSNSDIWLFCNGIQALPLTRDFALPVLVKSVFSLRLLNDLNRFYLVFSSVSSRTSVALVSVNDSGVATWDDASTSSCFDLEHSTIFSSQIPHAYLQVTTHSISVFTDSDNDRVVWNSQYPITNAVFHGCTLVVSESSGKLIVFSILSSAISEVSSFSLNYDISCLLFINEHLLVLGTYDSTLVFISFPDFGTVIHTQDLTQAENTYSQYPVSIPGDLAIYRSKKHSFLLVGLRNGTMLRFLLNTDRSFFLKEYPSVKLGQKPIAFSFFSSNRILAVSDHLWMISFEDSHYIVPYFRINIIRTQKSLRLAVALSFPLNSILGLYSSSTNEESSLITIFSPNISSNIFTKRIRTTNLNNKSHRLIYLASSNSLIVAFENDIGGGVLEVLNDDGGQIHDKYELESNVCSMESLDNDLFCVGTGISVDHQIGSLRLFKLTSERSLELLDCVVVDGSVNCLNAFSSDIILAGVGFHVVVLKIDASGFVVLSQIEMCSRVVSISSHDSFVTVAVKQDGIFMYQLSQDGKLMHLHSDPKIRIPITTFPVSDQIVLASDEYGTLLAFSNFGCNEKPKSLRVILEEVGSICFPEQKIVKVVRISSKSFVLAFLDGSICITHSLDEVLSFLFSSLQFAVCDFLNIDARSFRTKYDEWKGFVDGEILKIFLSLPKDDQLKICAVLPSKSFECIDLAGIDALQRLESLNAHIVELLLEYIN